MIKYSLLLFFCSGLFAKEASIITIDDKGYSLHQFYTRYPKKQWERADSLQKDKMLNDFIKRELCILEAERLGFKNDPQVATKIRSRSKQVLVNETYEAFVAKPLINEKDLELARTYAKTEIKANHILIGHSTSYLAKPPRRTMDEALLLAQRIKDDFEQGESFYVLADKYSEDPGAEQNSGDLGWVQWGATVPEFQLAAFTLEPGNISDPVLTDFGYHLILVSDSRPSDYQNVSDDAFETIIFNITKNRVRDRLRGAAQNYDSTKLKSYNVVFNSGAIEKIAAAFEKFQEEGAIGAGSSNNAVTLLNSVKHIDVLCVYDGKGYGPAWFAYRLEQVPASRRPSFSAVDRITRAFQTMILQDIAVKEGSTGGVEHTFPYKQKTGELASGILYDAYLKHLVNSAPTPDSSDVKEYYEEHKNEKYLGGEQAIIREIRVNNKTLADSLLTIVDSGAEFVDMAMKYSLTNPENGGEFGPFPRKNNKYIFDAAMLLEPEENSPVISTVSGQFSIVQLVQKVPPEPMALERVYVRIESLLIKENQNQHKADGINELFSKYSISKNISLLD